MATLGNYKGLQVFTPADPSGAGGLAINDDFKSLVDWSPKSNWDASADPTADDDSTDAATKNYQIGSLWYRTDTGVLFMCTDAAIGNAVWKLVLLQPETNKPLQADSDGDARGKDATDMQHSRSTGNLVASGDYATLSGGRNNQSEGESATVGGGLGSKAQGDYSTIPGGRQNRASGENTTAVGSYANASLYGHVAMASGRFTTHGDAQAGILIARNETDDATPAELYLDGTGERLVVPSGETWAFRGLLVARCTDSGTDLSAAWEFTGAIKNYNGTPTILGGSATVTSLGDDSSGTWSFAVTADTTHDALKLEVTGEASKTIRWVANISLSEVAG